MLLYMKFAFCSLVSAVVGNLDVHSLELKVWLQSGSSSVLDSTGVLISSKADNEWLRNQYIEILSTEKKEQRFRYLAELDIREIEISNDFIPVPVVEEIKFTETSLRDSVDELRTVLDELKKKHEKTAILTPDMVKAKIDSITSLPSDAQKANAERHVREMTFLLERYDVVLERLGNLDDLGDYTNHQKTPMEEVKSVSQTLFGKEVLHASLFNLQELDFASTRDVQLLRGDSVPLKVTMSSAAAGDIMKKILSFYSRDKMFGERRLSSFLSRVFVLSKDAELQYHKYAEFNGNDVVMVDVNKIRREAANEYIAKAEIARVYRKHALDEYKQFREPFLDGNGNVLFHFFLHDPEFRGVNFVSPSSPTTFPPFPNAVVARDFLDSFVMPSFKRIPESFFAGHLQSVVLVRQADFFDIRGQVHELGRSVKLVGDGRSFESVHNTVVHELAHGIDYLLDLAYRKELLKQEIALARQELLESDLPFKNSLEKAIEVYSAKLPNVDATNLEIQQVILKQITNIKEGRNPELGEQISLDREPLSVGDAGKIEAKLVELEKTKKLLEKKTGQYFGVMVDSFELPGTVSYYATKSTEEDFAEIVKHVANDGYRAALAERMIDDARLRRKVEAFLDVFGNALGEHDPYQQQRVELVKTWREDVTRMTIDAVDVAPVAVVMFTEKSQGSEIASGIAAEAKTFMREMIFKGRKVAWFDAYTRADGLLQVDNLLMSSFKSKPDIHLFAAPEASVADQYIKFRYAIGRQEFSPLGLHNDAQMWWPSDTVWSHRSGCVQRLSIFGDA